MTEEALFESAVKLAAAERGAFLERECAGKPELRARLEALLAADDRTGGWHEAKAAPAIDLAGTVVAGRYKLLQLIGEGGMGTVWMADQTEPVRRKVAVKIIRDDRGGERVLARFEAERQAIAIMDHPHIARLLDAGADQGRPYFVMELVKGIPITQFADNHKLTIPERIELFQQVCSAVQHAHQKGIIHRDLKPSNILVESHDGKPVPKVIDFGLAKASSSLSLTERTLFTAFGTVLGTPLYMAPEQATFNAVDVDTRADIYALGVILYELLTGSTPIEKERMKTAAFDEMLRVIREEEPPTPSLRISSAQARPSIAASRGSEPEHLGKFLKGELDWIVMKALAKERDRRYETANGLAQDLGRFLKDEPVLAGPPTAGYRVRKFLRRNWRSVAAMTFMVTSLTVGILVTTLAMVKAKQDRKIALDSLVQAEVLRKVADEARDKAAEAARQTRQKAQLLEQERDRALKAEKEAQAESERNQLWAEASGEIMKAFTGVKDPARRDLLIAQALDKVEEQLREKFKDQKDLEKSLRMNLGNAYFAVQDMSGALRNFQRLLEMEPNPKDSKRWDLLASIARLYRDQGKHAEAEPYWVRTDAILWVFQDEDDRIRVAEALKAGMAGELAMCRLQLGKLPEAEADARRCVAAWERDVARSQEWIDKDVEMTRKTQGVTNVKAGPPRQLTDLAKAHSLLGAIQMARKDWKVAGDSLTTAQKHLDRVAADKPMREEGLVALNDGMKINRSRLIAWAEASGLADEAKVHREQLAKLQTNPAAQLPALTNAMKEEWMLPGTRGWSDLSIETIAEIHYTSATSFERAWMFFAKKVGFTEAYDAATCLSYTAPSGFIRDESRGAELKHATRFMTRMPGYAVVVKLERVTGKPDDDEDEKPQVRVGITLIAR